MSLREILKPVHLLLQLLRKHCVLQLFLGPGFWLGEGSNSRYPAWQTDAQPTRFPCVAITLIQPDFSDFLGFWVESKGNSFDFKQIRSIVTCKVIFGYATACS